MQLNLNAVMVAVSAGILACTPAGGLGFEPASAGFSEVDASSSGGGETAASDSMAMPIPGDPPPDGEDTPDARKTLIPAHSPEWRSWVGSPPPAMWLDVDFADESWARVTAPVGDDGQVATLFDATTAPDGVWLRHHFVGTPSPDWLVFYLRRGSGAVVWLNGVEVVRSNVGDDPVTASTRATDNLSGDEIRRYLRWVVPASNLRDGDNVLAVAVRRATAADAHLGFDLQLDQMDPATAAAGILQVQWRTRRSGGEYTPRNVGAVWIEHADGGFVRTLTVWAGVRREHLVRWQASAADNRVDAMTSATRSSHRTSEASWDLRAATGEVVPAGAYRLVFEFTEDDSNKGAPAGPHVVVPLTIGAGPTLPQLPSHEAFADVTVIAP